MHARVEVVCIASHCTRSMAELFQKTVVLRAYSPISFNDGFKKLHVDLNLEEFGIPQAAPIDDPDNSHHIAKLCSRLSSLAGGSACVATPYVGATIYAICEIYIDWRQGDMKKTLGHAINKERKLQDVKISIDKEADDTVTAGLLLRKALQFDLLSVLIQQGWMALNGDLLVHKNLASCDEGQPVEVISMVVQLESNGQILLLVSPDLIRFRRFKANAYTSNTICLNAAVLGPSLDLVKCKYMLLWTHLGSTCKGKSLSFTLNLVMSILSEALYQLFEDGYEVDLGSWILRQTGDTIHGIKCFVVPIMMDGYVVGCSKTLPDDARFQESQELWLYKYGLVLPESYFYIKVCSTLDSPHEEDGTWTMPGLWYPSCCVFTRAGLMPVAPSIRSSKVASVLEHFITDAQAWNFFNKGGLSFEVVSLASTSTEASAWVTAKAALTPLSGRRESQISSSTDSRPSQFTSAASLLPKDMLRDISKYRRPKIVLNEATSKKKDENSEYCDESEQIQRTVHANLKYCVPSTQKLGVPHFTARKSMQPAECPSYVLPKSTTGKRRRDSGAPTSKKAMCTGSTQSTVTAGETTKQTSHRPQASGKKEMKGPTTTAICNNVEVRSTPAAAAAEAIKKPAARLMASSKAEREAATPKTIIPMEAQSAPADTKAATRKSKRGPRAAATEIDSTMIAEKVQSKYAEGKLKDLTVNELKNFLSAQKVKTSARRKDELIERVVQLLK